MRGQKIPTFCTEFSTEIVNNFFIKIFVHGGRRWMNHCAKRARRKLRLRQSFGAIMIAVSQPSIRERYVNWERSTDRYF